jgi:hypothetical protein
MALHCPYQHPGKLFPQPRVVGKAKAHNSVRRIAREEGPVNAKALGHYQRVPGKVVGACKKVVVLFFRKKSSFTRCAIESAETLLPRVQKVRKCPSSGIGIPLGSHTFHEKLGPPLDSLIRQEVRKGNDAAEESTNYSMAFPERVDSSKIRERTKGPRQQ